MNSIFHHHSPTRLLKSLGFAAAVTLASGSSLSAAILAEYTFAAVGDFTSSDTETNSTASQFLGASGFGANGSGRGGAGNFFIRSSVTGANQTEATSDNDYAGFTVTIGSGLQATLTTLEFTHTANVGGLTPFSESFTSSIEIWSSINNFTSSLGTNSVTQGGAGSNEGMVILDLSSYSNLTGNIEFRIYVFDDTTRNDDFTRFDGIKLGGDISSVPEPGGFLLASLGLLAGLRRKR